MILKKSFRFPLILFIIFISLNLFSQDTIVLQPGPEEGKDAYLRNLTPNTNYGDHHDFAAIAWTFHGPYVCTRSMIEFDLSDIPENTQILSAKLSLYGNPTSCNHQGHSSLSGSNESYLQRIITPWEEYTVTWNSHPLTTSENAIILRETNDPLEDYIDIDVTTLVQDMINDPENSYGFMIKLVNEEHYRSMIFSSSDQEDPDNHPKLEIIIFCESTIADFTTTIDDLIVQFTDASQNTDNWYWDFGDGSSSTQQNSSHKFEGHGIYYVCLMASNECSSDIFCDSIFNNPKGDNLNLIQVYPNPPSSTLTISNPTSLNKITVQIFTLYGDKLYEKEIDFEYNSTYKINLSDLPSAQYFFKLISDNNSETRKIFILK